MNDTPDTAQRPAQPVVATSPLLADRLWIAEVQKSGIDGYCDRFESIEKLVLSRGSVTMELTGDECRRVFRHLKPALYG